MAHGFRVIGTAADLSSQLGRMTRTESIVEIAIFVGFFVHFPLDFLEAWMGDMCWYSTENKGINVYSLAGCMCAIHSLMP